MGRVSRQSGAEFEGLHHSSWETGVYPKAMGKLQEHSWEGHTYYTWIQEGTQKQRVRNQWHILVMAERGLTQGGTGARRGGARVGGWQSVPDSYLLIHTTSSLRLSWAGWPLLANESRAALMSTVSGMRRLNAKCLLCPSVLWRHPAVAMHRCRREQAMHPTTARAVVQESNWPAADTHNKHPPG